MCAGSEPGSRMRDEPRRRRAVAVADAVVDQILPSHRTPRPWPGCSSAHDAAAVGLGADHQDELGRHEVPLHPAGPALRRRGVDVQVEDHVDPAIAEGVGQGEDAGGVLVRVVTVAEEYPRSIRHRADLPPSEPRPSTTACCIIRRTGRDVQPGTAARGGNTPPKDGRMLPHLRGSPGDLLAHSGRIAKKGIHYLS